MRNAADGVLNQPEYVNAAKPPSLRERLFDWVTDIFVDIFRSLSTVGGRGLFAWVIVGLFVLAILFLLSRLRGGSALRRPVSLGPTIEVQRELTAAQWRAEAESHEAAGDWRSGLRSRHRALVKELIDRDAISSRPGQTAGEVARTVANRVPAAAASIDVATRLFADTWYGGHLASAETRDLFEGHGAVVLNAVDAQAGDKEATRQPEPVRA